MFNNEGQQVDESQDAMQSDSVAYLDAIDQQLTVIHNSNSTVFMDPKQQVFVALIRDFFLGWGNLTEQQKILRLDEFVVRKNAIMDAMATTNFQQYEGYTMLNIAAYSRSDLIVEELLRRGVHVDNPANKRGETALHVGIERGSWSVAYLCVQHGADILRKTGYGQSALELVTKLHENMEKGDCYFLGHTQEQKAEDLAQMKKVLELMRSRTQRSTVLYSAPTANAPAPAATTAQAASTGNPPPRSICSVM